MTGLVQQAELQEKGMSEALMNGFFLKWWVPVYRELVAEFMVCDRWFASVSASTVNDTFLTLVNRGWQSVDVKTLIIEGWAVIVGDGVEDAVTLNTRVDGAEGTVVVNAELVARRAM
ncbi:hypothetical protein KSP40_PGU013706 [Platanthera guangdongensis]|uniref:Uncharacterized protein n=1 Tax=Platanthera guangdongensis TaxID=2320717 RepID=A0ABR2LU15_9ASPA